MLICSKGVLGQDIRGNGWTVSRSGFGSNLAT